MLVIATFPSTAYGQEVNEATKRKLSEVLSQITEAHGVRFNYNVDAVRDLQVKTYSYDRPLAELLDSVLQTTTISYTYLTDTQLALVPTKLAGKSICGYVRDGRTDEPLAYVDVQTTRQSALTDENGYFKLTLMEGDSTAVCRYLGYDLHNIVLNNRSLQTCQPYPLTQSNNELETVIVREYLDDGISLSNNASSVNIDLQKVQLLPGNVEADPLKTILFLPGISSASESLQEINIRGGTSDQNLMLWDDIPVFEVSHLFGSVSGLNPHAIQDVDVYRNGVSSRYGGRVSSVIDIKSKDYLPKKTTYTVGTNMLHSNLGVETPLGKRSALFVNGRFSLTNLWSSPPFESYAEQIFQGSKVDIGQFIEAQNSVLYSDVNFKWLYQTTKSKFTMSGLASSNQVIYRTVLEGEQAFVQDDLDLGQGGFKIGWERQWSKQLSSEVVMTSTTFDNEYGLSLQLVNLPDTVLASGELANQLVEGVIRTGLKYKISDSRVFRLGMQYTEDQIDIDFTQRELNNNATDSIDFSNKLLSFYGEYSMEIEKILTLDMGLRLNNSQEINKSFVEPRISLVTDLSPNLKLKLSTSKNYQFISQLVVFDRNELGIMNQTWVAANDSIVPVMEANQWSGGLLYTKGSWTVDVDAYVKDINGITSLNGNFATNAVPYAIGTANIKGLDLLVKKRWGKYRSWISYTWSDIDYDFPQLSADIFPASHHHTHNIRWAHLYKTGKFDFALGLQFRSGLPYTEATDIIDGRIEYASINGERLQDYGRIDCSMVYHLIHTKRLVGDLSFSIQNATDASNVLTREYVVTGQDQDILRTIDRVGLGFTPNIGVNFQF